MVMRAAALLIIVITALAASGCGGERISPDAATALLRESRAVEARLAAGDRCGADRRARALVGMAGHAIDAGLVPFALAGELRRRAARLSTAVTCPPPPPPPAVTPPAPQPAEEGDDEGHDKGKGKKKGHDR
jgi:hypothetical protein